MKDSKKLIKKEARKEVFKKLSCALAEYKEKAKTNKHLFSPREIKEGVFENYIDDINKYQPKFTNPLVSTLDKEIHSAVQPYITMQATTGLSIGILKNGKSFFYGYGETARGNKHIPDEN